MKRYRLYIVLLLIVFAIIGCVKDDNPYPDIRNTTWKRTNGENWQRVSFSAGRVHHEIFVKGDSDTFSLSDYYADYKEESEDGRHFFTWIYEAGNVRYRVFSLGSDNVVIDSKIYSSGPSMVMEDYGVLFYRDNDPVGGYDF